MAVTVVPDLTLLYHANNTTGWSGGDQNTEVQVFETGCLEAKVSNATSNFMYTLPATQDLSNTHYYAWMWVTTANLLHATAGIRIRLQDSGGNQAEWDVAGANNYTGGWQCFAIYTESTPSRFTSGSSINLSNITHVGVTFQIVDMALTVNCFWDVARFGSGLRIQGGTSGDPGKWSEIFEVDSSINNAYGIVNRFGGVYFVQGKLLFGDNVGSTSSVFRDSGQVVVFTEQPQQPMADDLYEIRVVGNATETTEFQDGEKVGTGDAFGGRAGSIYRASSPAVNWKFNATHANAELVRLYGTGIRGATMGVEFSDDVTNAPNHELGSVAFVNSDQVHLGRVVARDCIFSENLDLNRASLMWNENINIRNSRFIANEASIEHPTHVGSPYVYNNLQFAANEFDVNNTSGEPIEIELAEGSNAGTFKGDDVTFLVSATHTLLNLVEGTRVTYVLTGTNDDVFEAVAGGSGITNFSYTEPMTVDIMIHHPNYVHIMFIGVSLGDTDAEIPIFQAPDRVYTSGG